jgi:hypothetical protein
MRAMRRRLALCMALTLWSACDEAADKAAPTSDAGSQSTGDARLSTPRGPSNASSAAASLDALIDEGNIQANMECSCPKERKFYGDLDDCLASSSYIDKSRRACLQRVLTRFPIDALMACWAEATREETECYEERLDCDDLTLTTEGCSDTADIRIESCIRLHGSTDPFEEAADEECPEPGEVEE